MHAELDKAWSEVHRSLKDGAIACINIGDATRTIGGCFRRYSNHSRTTDSFERAGLVSLPSIIWRKPTNAPNKFMGSGMLPPGAYVTLEHEHILVFRKGERRLFDTPDEKRLRSESSYFWEERNLWFSDVWTDIAGAGQSLNGGAGRQRSGAFPFEVPYRLINMFSVKGDLVLDPFLGTGTTTLAAAASQRNSLGYEIDEAMVAVVRDRLKGLRETANDYIARRISRHRDFAEGRKCGSVNEHHGFPCVSSQETAIRLELLDDVDIDDNGGVTVKYGGLAR
jgi:DNA modification methylase